MPQQRMALLYLLSQCSADVGVSGHMLSALASMSNTVLELPNDSEEWSSSWPYLQQH